MRLRIAIDDARERIGAERRFTMRLHGFKVEEPPPPDQTADEVDEGLVNLMMMFRAGRPSGDDEDD